MNGTAARGGARAWLLAMRPKTLAAGAVPVLVGTALAAAATRIDWWVAAACLLGALLIQVGVNFANDAFDALSGADGADRLGPTRAVASGLISARAMFRATALALALALLIGLCLARIGGWPVLLLGMLAIVCAVAYTGGPFPLAHHGLGDLFVFLFFGLFAVLGSAWLQVADLPGDAGQAPRLLAMPIAWWLVAAAVGLQASAIIAINNLRDIATDAPVGKRTLAVRMGARGARAYHALLHLGAGLCLVLAGAPAPAALAGAGGVALALAVARRDGRALNPCLGLAALLELLTGVLLALTWR